MKKQKKKQDPEPKQALKHQQTKPFKNSLEFIPVGIEYVAVALSPVSGRTRLHIRAI